MIPKDIKGICELFDCNVVTDLAPKGFGDGHNNLKPIYYLGTPTELSAGLHGTRLSKHFFTKTALERYCSSKRDMMKSTIWLRAYSQNGYQIMRNGLKISVMDALIFGE